MIGLLIVTHGRLATELRAAMEHVVGPQEAMETVCVGAEDDLDVLSQAVGSAIKAVDRGHGVILLTDMFGGTPSNLCVAAMGRPDVEVLGGVNLPMLVKLASARLGDDMKQAIEWAQAAGRKYIAVASEAIPHCRARAKPLAALG